MARLKGKVSLDCSRRVGKIGPSGPLVPPLGTRASVRCQLGRVSSADMPDAEIAGLLAFLRV